MSISIEQEPPIAKGHFLWGHLFNVKNEGIHFYERMLKENGDAFKINILHKSYYVFLNPEYNREILVEKADLFIKGAQYNSLRLLLGNGLLTSEGKKWAQQRKMLNPLFGKEGMDILLIHIDQVTKQFISDLIIDKEIDWTKNMFDYTLSVAIAAFFGTNIEKNKIDQFTSSSMDCIRFISRRMSNLIHTPIFLPTKENRNFKKSYFKLKNFVDDIYLERMKSTSLPKDMLDLLMNAKDENGNNLSREEVWDQILSFMMAGHETTALTMSWLFYLLANNPDVQNKIDIEAQKNNYQLSNSLALNQYPYLNAVLNETMRLYPAGWIISRDIAQDSTVGIFKVKKGNVLAVSPYITHRDPRYWKNPEEFIPERFLEGDPLFNKAPKNTFIPFSIGRRNCIGSRFALLEMANFTINFIQKYRVTTNQKNVGVKGFVTLKSDKPIKISISSRS